jgi:DNA-binding NarL/FixJ family response regulator
MIIEDNELMRAGVRALIEADHGFEVCAEAATRADALALVSKLRPEVVVVDPCLPQSNGAKLISELKSLAPQLHIMVLTSSNREDMLGESINHGARAYVLKSDGGTVIMEALNSISNNRAYFSASTSVSLARHIKRSKYVGLPLTDREWAVDRLVAEGNTNKDIAEMLNISIKTVETHRTAALRKGHTKRRRSATLR